MFYENQKKIFLSFNFLSIFKLNSISSTIFTVIILDLLETTSTRASQRRQNKRWIKIKPFTRRETKLAIKSFRSNIKTLKLFSAGWMSTACGQFYTCALICDRVKSIKLNFSPVLIFRFALFRDQYSFMEQIGFCCAFNRLSIHVKHVLLIFIWLRRAHKRSPDRAW